MVVGGILIEEIPEIVKYLRRHYVTTDGKEVYEYDEAIAAGIFELLKGCGPRGKAGMSAVEQYIRWSWLNNHPCYNAGIQDATEALCAMGPEGVAVAIELLKEQEKINIGRAGLVKGLAAAKEGGLDAMPLIIKYVYGYSYSDDALNTLLAMGPAAVPSILRTMPGNVPITNHEAWLSEKSPRSRDQALAWVLAAYGPAIMPQIRPLLAFNDFSLTDEQVDTTWEGAAYVLVYLHTEREEMIIKTIADDNPIVAMNGIRAVEILPPDDRSPAILEAVHQYLQKTENTEARSKVEVQQAAGPNLTAVRFDRLGRMRVTTLLKEMSRAKD